MPRGQPRVCIVRRAYYPAESHVRRNAESLVAAGYAVDVVCLRSRGEQALEHIDGVRVFRLPLQAQRGGLLAYLLEYGAFFLMVSIIVPLLSMRRRYAVAEYDSMPDLLVFAGLLPRLMGTRLILFLFESMPELWAQKRGVAISHWTSQLLCWQEEAASRFADAVICCHEMARDALVGRGVEEDKVSVILNVPDEQWLPQSQAGARPADGCLRLIQHGTIADNYGHQVVLEALKRLDPALPIHFDIVGDGEYRPALEAMARQWGLQGRVTFHGYVPRARLATLLGAADVGVVPMRFEYQSPNKMFEYVAMAKPIIASDRQTFRQHFGEREILYFQTGSADDLARAIAEACSDPAEMRAQARRASRRYGRYRWREMRKRYWLVYERLLAELLPAADAPSDLSVGVEVR